MEEILVGKADAVLELGAVTPAEALGLADIEELARGAVGTCGIPLDLALEAYDTSHHLGKGLDGEFLAGAGVNRLIARVVVHEEDAEVGKIVDIEELAQGTAIAPAGDLGESGYLGLVETTDEGRQDVGVLGVIVVVGTIEVGGHDGDVVGAVLAIEELAILESADLGQGIGLVGLLELGGEQAALGHGLGCHAGIDAAGTEELELLAPIAPCGVDDVHLEDHIVVHEIGQRTLVGHDAAYLGGSQEDVLGTLLGEKGLDLVLTAEIQLAVGTGDDVGIALTLQLAYDG